MTAFEPDEATAFGAPAIDASDSAPAEVVAADDALTSRKGVASAWKKRAVVGGIVVGLLGMGTFAISKLVPRAASKQALPSANGGANVSTSRPGLSGAESTATGASTTVEKRTSKPYDATMRAALRSVSEFWGKNISTVYDVQFRPLKGGVYAYSSGSRIPPCDGQAMPYLLLQENAFYCPESDFIAWDDEGLFPRLEKKFGRFLLAVVLAHEWGHAVQERTATYLETIYAEQQADCFAGAWAASLSTDSNPELVKLRDAELDRALSGLIEFRDVVGMTPSDFGAHGSGFDRVRAFQDGFTSGLATCAGFADRELDLVAIGFRSMKERFRGGNLPYEQVFPTVEDQLTRYWQSSFGAGPIHTGPATDFPLCFAGPLSPPGFSETTFTYCPDDGRISYDDASMKALYDHTGDFGPATVLAVSWSAARLLSLGGNPADRGFWQRATCTAGAWTATLFDADVPENSLLSPGDLDEAVMAVLDGAGKSSPEKFGTGFEQVSAFRSGFVNGGQNC